MVCCETCGNEIPKAATDWPARYAAKRLTDLSSHGLEHHPPQHPTTKVCAMCGSTFTPHKSKRKRAVTCGRACGTAWSILQRHGAESLRRHLEEREAA